MITSPYAVFATLAGIGGFFLWLEARTRWALFEFLPPMLCAYALPVVLSNLGVLPHVSSVYDALTDVALPALIVLLLMSVDLGAAVRVVGRGLVVMAAASAGIVLGGVVSYALVRTWLPPDGWKMFGAIAGAWTGGTGNMVAIAESIGMTPQALSVAILTDSVINLLWFPVLVSGTRVAPAFARWAGVKSGAADGVVHNEALHTNTGAALRAELEPAAPSVANLVYLMAIVSAVVAASRFLAPLLPELGPVLTTGTWRTLILSTLALALSFTSARRLPLSREAGTALIYVFLAGMGARASLSGLAEAPVMLAAGALWVCIHGACAVLGARLVRAELGLAAISSMACLGGAATTPIVAARYREALVPAGILLALIGYAEGNYVAVVTAQLCAGLAPQ